MNEQFQNMTNRDINNLGIYNIYLSDLQACDRSGELFCYELNAAYKKTRIKPCKFDWTYDKRYKLIVHYSFDSITDISDSEWEKVFRCARLDRVIFLMNYLRGSVSGKYSKEEPGKYERDELVKTLRRTIQQKDDENTRIIKKNRELTQEIAELKSQIRELNKEILITQKFKEELRKYLGSAEICSL